MTGTRNVLKAMQLIGACVVAAGLAAALMADSNETAFWVGVKLCIYGGLFLLVASIIAWWKKS